MRPFCALPIELQTEGAVFPSPSRERQGAPACRVRAERRMKGGIAAQANYPDPRPPFHGPVLNEGRR